MELDGRGSLSLEAAIVMPMVMVFIAIMMIINVKVFKYVERYEKIQQSHYSQYVDVHRKVSAIFDAGGNIYEILFG